MPSLFSSLKTTFRNFVSTDDDLDTEADESQSAQAGVQKIADVKAREKGTFLGQIRAVTTPPTGTQPVFEAELFDGTGELGLIWLGRTHVTGIAAGITMRVSGRVAAKGKRLVIFNPVYCVQPEA